MSVTLVLQAAAWVAVVLLVGAELQIARGQLSRQDRSYRVVGSLAAAAVVALGIWQGIWPVAVLGLLWLRTEIWRHRHDPDPAPEAAQQPQADHREPATSLDALLAPPRNPRPEPELVPAPRSLTRPSRRPPDRVALPPDDREEAPASTGFHVPHPHVPRPHLAKRTVDRVFKVEMALLIAIGVTLFGVWMVQNDHGFRQNTNDRLCRMMGPGCSR